MSDIACERCVVAIAEIERLRTEVRVVTDEWVAARDEIRRLRTVNAALLAALQRIDGINDNPACFNAEIDAVVMPAIALSKGEKP